MAIRASGFVFLMHFKKFFIPMPGSMMTGTAPILKSAKTLTIRSRPGLTMMRTFMPGVMPRLIKVLATPFVFSSNSLKLQRSLRWGTSIAVTSGIC